MAVFTNSRTTGPATLSVLYDFFQNGVFYTGSGTDIPGGAFQENGKTATLNLEISTLTNLCFALAPCTPRNSGSVTLAWKVNGLLTFDLAGTMTETTELSIGRK